MAESASGWTRKSLRRTMAKRRRLLTMRSEGGMMHNYEFGSSGGTHQDPYGRPEGGDHGKHSVFSLIVMIVVVAVLAVAGLSIVFWALGFLFHLAGWILRIAVLA